MRLHLMAIVCLALAFALGGTASQAAQPAKPDGSAGGTASPGRSPRTIAAAGVGHFSAVGQGLASDASVYPNVSVILVQDDTVFLGGDFDFAVGYRDDSLHNLAAWAPGPGGDDTYRAIGPGTDLPVRALLTRDDTLYIGGDFTAAYGGTPCTLNNIAMWSPGASNYTPLGHGLECNSPSVNALAATDDTLFIGGSFSQAFGGATNSLNGITAWASGPGGDDTFLPVGPVGQPGLAGTVYALAIQDDTLYIGGDAPTSSSNAPVNNFAQWPFHTTGADFSGVNGGVSSIVYALAPMGDRIAVGGLFQDAGDPPLRVNAVGSSGTGPPDDTYHAFLGGLGNGDPMNAGTVTAFLNDATHGLLYAGGSFTYVADATSLAATDDTAQRVAVWDEGISAWIPLAYGDDSDGVNNQVRAFAFADSSGSSLYVGGDFTDAGDVGGADYIARWTWDPPQGGNTISAAINDTVVVAGQGFIGVPTTGAVRIGSTTAAYTRGDTTSIVVTVPSTLYDGIYPIYVEAVGGTANVGTLTVTGHPTAEPSSPPRHVTATAAAASAAVTWTAPTSSGSSAISTYEVAAAPGGKTCLTSSLFCTVTGLTNDTAYTFTVRALNASGWSAASNPSNSVTPRASEAPTIVITGSRVAMQGRPGVRIEGVTTGLIGAEVASHTKFPGESGFTTGGKTVKVADDGTFAWQRKTAKKINVYFTGGGTRSNIVTIQAA